MRITTEIVNVRMADVRAGDVLLDPDPSWQTNNPTVTPVPITQATPVGDDIELTLARPADQQGTVGLTSSRSNLVTVVRVETRR